MQTKRANIKVPTTTDNNGYLGKNVWNFFIFYRSGLSVHNLTPDLERLSTVGVVILETHYNCQRGVALYTRYNFEIDRKIAHDVTLCPYLFPGHPTRKLKSKVVFCVFTR